MKRFDGFLGKAGLVVATAVVTTTLAGSGVASAFNVPTNSVDSNKIVNESIRSIDIKNGTVASVDVRDNSLTTGDVLDSTITGSDIADSSIGGNDIAFGSVGGGDITDGSVLGADLATGTVTSSDLSDSTVTGTDLANGTVGPNDLAANVQTRWAKVDGGATASLQRGRGAVSASRAGAGNYVVQFSSSITACGWTATVNDNAAGSVSELYAAVEQNNPADNNSLRVRIFNAAGVEVDTPNDDGFTVTVVC